MFFSVGVSKVRTIWTHRSSLGGHRGSRFCQFLCHFLGIWQNDFRWKTRHFRAILPFCRQPVVCRGTGNACRFSPPTLCQNGSHAHESRSHGMFHVEHVAKGRQIGSGPVESACKTVIELRIWRRMVRCGGPSAASYSANIVSGCAYFCPARVSGTGETGSGSPDSGMTTCSSPLSPAGASSLSLCLLQGRQRHRSPRNESCSRQSWQSSQQ